MATHSSILAWKIPTDKGAWWLQSMWLQRVGHQSDYYSLKGFLGEYGPYAFYLCPLLLAEA